jgi:hypothetical protein
MWFSFLSVPLAKRGRTGIERPRCYIPGGKSVKAASSVWVFEVLDALAQGIDGGG